MGRERDARTGSSRPPEEPALREAFGTQPKPLPIVGQEFERGGGAVAKDVDGAAQRILTQRLATQGREPIYSLPEIDGLHGEKDAALGRELQHQRVSRNVWSNGASAGEASLYVMRRRVPSGR